MSRSTKHTASRPLWSTVGSRPNDVQLPVTVQIDKGTGKQIAVSRQDGWCPSARAQNHFVVREDVFETVVVHVRDGEFSVCAPFDS